MRGWGWTSGMLLGLSLVSAAAASPFEATRAQALKAYEARDFKRACDLYARAAKQRPEHAAVRADLGLCLARLGKTQAAVRENARAVFLARPREDASPDDERTRKAAYFNLFTLGERLKAPDPGQCGPLPKAPGCTRAVHACGVSFTASLGASESYEGEAVRLGLTAAAVSAPSGVDRSDILDFHPGPEGVRPFEDQVFSSALVIVDEDKRMSGMCWARAQWRCDASNAVSAATDVCARARVPEGTEPSEAVYEDCLARDCRRAETAPWPEVLAEQQKVGGYLDSCDRMAEALVSNRCSLVLADACAGVVGVMCEPHPRSDTEKVPRQVGEVRLEEPPPPEPGEGVK